MPSDRDARHAVRLLGVSLIVLAVVMCTGCGRPEAAKAVRMSTQAVEAARAINAQPEATTEGREAINRLLTTSLTLQAPALAALEAGEPVQVQTTTEQAQADPLGFAQAAQVQADAAWREEEDAAWWRGVLRTVGGWIDVATQSTLGFSLGLAGGATGLLAAGAKALGWRRRIKSAAERVAAWQEASDIGGDRAGEILSEITGALGSREVERERSKRRKAKS